MSVRIRSLAAVVALFIAMLIVGTSVSSSAESAAPAIDMSYSTTLDLPADDQLSPDMCIAEDEPQELDPQADSFGYECPRGIPYCQKNSQCVDYCGSVEFGVCFQGCCTCAG